MKKRIGTIKSQWGVLGTLKEIVEALRSDSEWRWLALAGLVAVAAVATLIIGLSR